GGDLVSAVGVSESLCDRLYGAPVPFICCPFAREVLERDRTLSRQRHGPRQNIALRNAGARGGWLGYGLAGVDNQVLELSPHTRRHIGEAIPGYASASRADTSEVALARIDVTALSVPAAEGAIVGFDEHLEEGVVPTDPQLLSEMLIPVRDIVEARIEIGVPGFEERQQAFRRHAGGDTVVGARTNRRSRGESRRCSPGPSRNHTCGEKHGIAAACTLADEVHQPSGHSSKARSSALS